MYELSAVQIQSLWNPSLERDTVVILNIFRSVGGFKSDLIFLLVMSHTAMLVLIDMILSTFVVFAKRYLDS